MRLEYWEVDTEGTKHTRMELEQFTGSYGLNLIVGRTRHGGSYYAMLSGLMIEGNQCSRTGDSPVEAVANLVRSIQGKDAGLVQVQNGVNYSTILSVPKLHIGLELSNRIKELCR